MLMVCVTECVVFVAIDSTTKMASLYILWLFEWVVIGRLFTKIDLSYRCSIGYDILCITSY